MIRLQSRDIPLFSVSGFSGNVVVEITRSSLKFKLPVRPIWKYHGRARKSYLFDILTGRDCSKYRSAGWLSQINFQLHRFGLARLLLVSLQIWGNGKCGRGTVLSISG